MEKIGLKEDKKVYFASDFHLGAPDFAGSREREIRIVQWLDQIKSDAQIIFLVGDLFDFWYEHKRVAPQGYIRFLGKLAELRDSGIRIIVFQGNHDMWMKDYLIKEIGVEIYREPQEYIIGNKHFYVGHGDGLGPGDHFYKLLKIVFESKVCRWLFGNLVHPDLSLKLGYAWASHSWKKKDLRTVNQAEINPENELLYLYCKEMEQQTPRDFYIFGHRHLKLDFQLNTGARYINLGDWISYFSYAEFNGETLRLKDFPISS